MTYILYHAIIAAPHVKMEPMDFEKFVPTWWSEPADKTETADSNDVARERLKAKVATAFAAFGGVDKSGS